jgi:septal ring factor EnvC (AmiA/AmiB activator)
LAIPDGILDEDGPDAAGGLDRLERAVGALLERARHVQAENAALRARLGERDVRIETLEQELREQHQRRQDVIKRIDDLIGQIDHLDGQLVTRAGRSRS